MFILADPTTDRASVYGLISPMFSASMILHCLFGGIALATNSTLDSKIFRWRVAVRVGVHDIFGGVHNGTELWDEGGRQWSAIGH